MTMKTKRKIRQANFIISIDDNFVEYKYPINLPEKESINSIAVKIFKSLRRIKPTGIFRRKSEYF